MISKFGLPWHFVCHYLPKDDDFEHDQIELERRSRVISQYCSHRNATLDTLERLVEWCQGVDFNWYILERQYNISNQEILEYLIKRCPSTENRFLNSSMKVACKYGYQSTVKLICSIKGVQLDKKAMNAACTRMDSLSEGCTTYALDMAAKHGNLDIVKFLHFNRTEGCSKNAMHGAAKNGHLKMIQFLHEHRQEEHRSEGATTDAMDWAAKNGHIDVVKYLSEHRSEGATKRQWIRPPKIDIVKIECRIDTLKAAIFGGKLDSFYFIYDQVSMVPSRVWPEIDQHHSEGATTSAIDQASGNGHIEIVKYLSEHRSEGATTKAMDEASVVVTWM
ncbi:hypothetical protein DFA_04434 [Cavenderia fasciculata]|uniref:Ankyrin repeat-containing protein n=1 Tax=Cavenderia fasciculata TaxID=261658 RepID=F4PPK3_CACFS|nr:uncharacterized protein DFA_04434 [Cavenderia fasciculata]EGG22316.1 hypothetical protein DFA_04434 [Cavenderia fasciculata]|eukprot:XP_004360167.1 hypothetical protein DFA_04434 [Cavenderia fasciculata]